MALIGSYFAESLRSAGERLEEAAGEVADLQELNQVIVDSIHSGLVIADAAGRILYVNDVRRSRSWAGARPTSGDAACARCSARPLLEPPALRGPRRRRPPWPGSSSPTTGPTGRRCELGLSVSPLAAGARTGRGYLLVFQDLTEIKRLEQEVRTKEKLAAVGEMAAQLAHEIRNPLGSISGSAQVLMAEAEHLRRAGAPARHHHPRVEAPLRDPEPVPVPGPRPAPAARARGHRPARGARR